MSIPPADTDLLTGTGSLRDRLHDALLTGVAVTIPLIVTLLVVGFAVDFLSGVLNPIVGVINGLLGYELPVFVVKVISLLTIIVAVVGIGAIANGRPDDGSIEDSFDSLMMRIPGIGSVYRSFNEMSQLLLDSDTDSFQEVVLVEYPGEESYAVAFLTADTPEKIEDATGHPEMQTVFVPMAPNPVMGGFVIHVSEDRLTHVDMTVEEGIESIVTSGVAIGNTGVTEEATSGSHTGQPHFPDRVHRQNRVGEHGPDRSESIGDPGAGTDSDERDEHPT